MNFAATMLKTPTSQRLECFLLVLFTVICFSSLKSVTPQNLLSRGYSLSVQDDKTILTSPNKAFTFGFYGLGENAYWLSIWFANSKDRSIVWMANREKPVNGRGSKLAFKKDGALVLTDADGSMIWETNTSSTDARIGELLDSGNFVLKDSHGKVLWQSFDFPTDTLLPRQLFRKSTRLVSSSGRGNFGSGYFSFYFDDNNVLTLMYDGPEISSIYWPDPDDGPFGSGRTTYNSSRVAFFDELGNFSSSDQLRFSASDLGFGVQRRLTLDFDGNLRLYSLNKETGLWVVTWEALSEQCKVHGICGRNGICVYNPQPMCSCPPGFEVVEPDNWGKGCKPKFNRSCSKSQLAQFVQIPYVDFYGFDFSYTKDIDLDSCMKLCLEDCQCEAFSYRLTGERVCFTKSALFNGYRSPSFPGSIYIKLPAYLETSEPAILHATDPECMSNSAVLLGSSSMYDTVPRRVKWLYLYWFACAIGVIEVLFVVSGWWLLYRRHGAPAIVEDGYQVISSPFRQFTYGELKKATRNFKEELGKGSSGSVYKGVLVDKREVAVKRLGEMMQGEGEFWSEVSTIGKINHINLVRMWGFCSEGRHRFLVYEYMEFRSLDKHLFAPSFIGWKERFQVALGTAKALAYLHHECLEWIIHCDVKPENILLNREYEPKIADFGLAKLFQRTSNSTEFSHIRGTKGYMAPEWASNLPITAKVDVYSYGVVILEMVRGIRLSNIILDENGVAEESELTRFIRVAKSEIQRLKEPWIEEIVDPRLDGEVNRKQLMTIVEVGIACVEEDRNKRPAMDSVVQALLECEDMS